MKGIYLITNNINGHRYVGLSNDIQRRWMEHRAPKNISSKSTVLCRAFRKYGIDNFSFSILEQVNNDAELPERERFWIAKLNPEYNMNEGGLGNCGLVVSEETKKVLSERGKAQWQNMSDEQRAKICKNFKRPEKGHPVSMETRKKLATANIGKKQSAESNAKRSASMKLVMKGNQNGNKMVCGINERAIYIFNSVKSSGEFFGVHPSCITGVLKGRRAHSCGLNWFYWSVETMGDECNPVGMSLSHPQVQGIHKDEEIVHSIRMVNLWASDKGLLQLAIRSQLYRTINADCVYEGEAVVTDRISGEMRITGEKTADNVIGYFAYFEMTNGFRKSIYWPREKVESHAKRYSKSVTTGPWKTDFDAMAQKTVLKQLLGKYGAMSTTIQNAIKYDQIVINEDGKETYADNPSEAEKAEQNEKAAAIFADAMGVTDVDFEETPAEDNLKDELFN